MNAQTRYKLTGDAKRLWESLVSEYGVVLKERHKPLLFAMCQQWELYLKGVAKAKRNKDPEQERRLHYQANASLKLFRDLSRDFAMGINDELKFTIPDRIEQPSPGKKAVKSRIAELLEKVPGKAETN